MQTSAFLCHSESCDPGGGGFSAPCWTEGPADKTRGGGVALADGVNGLQMLPELSAALRLNCLHSEAAVVVPAGSAHQHADINTSTLQTRTSRNHEETRHGNIEKAAPGAPQRRGPLLLQTPPLRIQTPPPSYRPRPSSCRTRPSCYRALSLRLEATPPNYRPRPSNDRPRPPAAGPAHSPGSTTQNKNVTLACDKSDLYRRLCSEQADV